MTRSHFILQSKYLEPESIVSYSSEIHFKIQSLLHRELDSSFYHKYSQSILPTVQIGLVGQNMEDSVIGLIYDRWKK